MVSPTTSRCCGGRGSRITVIEQEDLLSPQDKTVATTHSAIASEPATTLGRARP